jgi:hypothetical protein
MHPIECPFKPVTVATISGDFPRYHQFYTSLQRLLVPVGSSFKTVFGNGFASLRNTCIKEMDPEAEWIWFIDDDHPFDANVLLDLLKNDVDIVQPLVLTRKPPHWPYVYRYLGDGAFSNYMMDELPTEGLFEADAVGTGGMLIRRKVFEAVADPWFEEGKTAKDAIGEDLYFCLKAREAGFKVYVDCSVRMGHMCMGAVWPHVEQGADGVRRNQVVMMNGSSGIVLPDDFGMSALRAGV